MLGSAPRLAFLVSLVVVGGVLASTAGASRVFKSPSPSSRVFGAFSIGYKSGAGATRVTFSYTYFPSERPAGKCRGTSSPSPDRGMVVCDLITISGFHFSNRCSASGTTVRASIPVRHGRFVFKRPWVRVTGAIGPRSGNPVNEDNPPIARGTAWMEREGPPECESGPLRWRARAG